MSMVDIVAEAIWRAATGQGRGTELWRFPDGIPADAVTRYRIMARAAIDALQQDGAALVDRKTLDALKDCYGDEFVDGLHTDAPATHRRT